MRKILIALALTTAIATPAMAAPFNQEEKAALIQMYNDGMYCEMVIDQPTHYAMFCANHILLNPNYPQAWALILARGVCNIGHHPDWRAVAPKQPTAVSVLNVSQGNRRRKMKKLLLATAALLCIANLRQVQKCLKKVHGSDCCLRTPTIANRCRKNRFGFLQWLIVRCLNKRGSFLRFLLSLSRPDSRWFQLMCSAVRDGAHSRKPEE